jgi:DNA-binding HxlR family transcriptional regulator
MKSQRVGVKAKFTTFDLDSVVLSRSVGLIAGKWRVKIICHLFSGTKRFSELLRLLPIVHRGTLTYELRGLQADGIIDRTQYPTIPPTVEYKLTARGTALRPVLIALQRWSNSQKLEATRSQPDKAARPGHDVFNRETKFSRLKSKKEICRLSVRCGWPVQIPGA